MGRGVRFSVYVNLLRCSRIYIYACPLRMEHLGLIMKNVTTPLTITSADMCNITNRWQSLKNH